MLASRYAMCMGWGPEFYFFCNDAYLPTVGIKENWMLGASARKVLEEVWRDVGPRAELVVKTGDATWDKSVLLFLERSGYPEETYHTFSYSPIPDDSGAIGGMLCVVTEDTERVIGERRLAMLRELGADLAAINTEDQLFSTIRRHLDAHAKDLPFALIYLCAADGKETHLACAHNAKAGDSIAPPVIDLGSDDAPWPVQKLFANGAPITVDDLTGRFDAVPTGPWDKPPRQAVMVPITQQGPDRPAGFLIAGINPYRPFDTAYSGFVNLLAGQIAAALASARGCEEERKRAAARREAAEAMRESDKRMLQLTSLMPAAVYVCDEQGRITFFNRRAAEIWGREPKLNDSSEKYGGSLRILGLDGSQIPQGEGPMAIAVKTGKPVRNEEAIIERPDGSRIILKINIDPLFDSDGRLCGAINVFEDVTDLKRAEQAGQRLAAIVESSDDAIISKDLKGIITSWNQAATRLFGYTAEEVIGKPITLLIPPERHDEEPRILESVMRGKRIDHYETIRRRKDGSLLDVSLTVSPVKDVKGNIIGASKIGRDITRRKQVEVALRESEQRFSLATLTGKLGVWDWDIVTNRISWSDSLYTIHGVRADEFDGTVEGFTALIHPEDQGRVCEAIQRALDKDATYELEFRAVRPDGTVIWLFTNATVLREGERPVRMAGATMDITERKRMEEALRQSEEKLRRQAQELEQQLIMSGRLVSLGEVTASMAHEFNNPLGIIMGFVEDMLSSRDPTDPDYRSLQIIDEESKRCRQIVKDLMEYARPRSTEFCSTSISDAIDKTLQLVENRLYKQKVTVEKKLEPDLPPIQADSQQLEQVLVNLYLNAIDAMPEGGKLIVEANIAQLDGTAPMAVITVADTGFGIAETDLGKIFQPFFTAKKRRGMGLGLSICQRILKNHGGRIAVESQPGEGTTFKIHLPLDRSAMITSEEPANER
jgi:PAS domain S-box-containing protein